ncbi:MAG: HPP family protein [Actinomycetota bacterium]|nr:HPP family protein [Actinomycetota bacterium]
MSSPQRAPREVRQRAPRRGGLKGELALAALPTLTVLAVFFLVQVFTQQTFLFASLASSAFLIYKEPENGMNQVKTLVPAHLTAAVVGLGTFFVFGEGLLAGGVSMALTIALLVTLGIVHPPAVSSSLAFAFRAHQESEFVIFLLAVFMVAALFIIERFTVVLLHRYERRMRESG